MAEVYGLTKKDFIGLDDYQAWVRIKNKNSLVKTFPAPVPEIIVEPPVAATNLYEDMETQSDSMKDIGGETTTNSIPSCNFLKDCWFPC